MVYIGKIHSHIGSNKRITNFQGEVADSGAFFYGNRKCLALKFGDSEWASFDIRYDKHYDKNNERGYIEHFIKNELMSGKFGKSDCVVDKVEFSN